MQFCMCLTKLQFKMENDSEASDASKNIICKRKKLYFWHARISLCDFDTRKDTSIYQTNVFRSFFDTLWNFLVFRGIRALITNQLPANVIAAAYIDNVWHVTKQFLYLLRLNNLKLGG